MNLLDSLKKTPVIPGIRDLSQLKQAVEHPGPLFLLAGDVFDLRQVAQVAGERTLAHVDLLGGIGRDVAGIRLLKEELGVGGILSTRSQLIKAAQDLGLLAILRLFFLDSEAIETGLKVVHRTKPDAVEILPAPVLPHLAHRLPFQDLPPVIGGGLIETRQQIREILSSGAVAVSTSRTQLWNYPL